MSEHYEATLNGLRLYGADAKALAEIVQERDRLVADLAAARAENERLTAAAIERVRQRADQAEAAIERVVSLARIYERTAEVDPTGEFRKRALDIRAALAGSSQRDGEDPEELDVEGVEVELDANLPPRNADGWKPFPASVRGGEAPDETRPTGLMRCDRERRTPCRTGLHVEHLWRCFREARHVGECAWMDVPEVSIGPGPRRAADEGERA